MLPQAFGPFSGDSQRELMRGIAEKATWIFARDESLGAYSRNGRFTAENQCIPRFHSSVAGGENRGIPALRE